MKLMLYDHSQVSSETEKFTVCVDVPKNNGSFVDGDTCYNQIFIKSLTNYWNDQNTVSDVTIYDIYKGLGLHPSPFHANLVIPKGATITIILEEELESCYRIRIDCI